MSPKQPYIVCNMGIFFAQDYFLFGGNGEQFNSTAMSIMGHRSILSRMSRTWALAVCEQVQSLRVQSPFQFWIRNVTVAACHVFRSEFCVFSIVILGKTDLQVKKSLIHPSDSWNAFSHGKILTKTATRNRLHIWPTCLKSQHQQFVPLEPDPLTAECVWWTHSFFSFLSSQSFSLHLW